MKCFKCGGMQMLRCEHTGGGIYWLCSKCNSTVESTSNSNEIVNNKAEDKYIDEHKLKQKAKESWWNNGSVSGAFTSSKIYVEGYITGAKENGIVWHDLRKDPNDLPNVEGGWVCNQDGYPCFFDWHTEQWLDTEGTQITTVEWCNIPHISQIRSDYV